MRLPPFPSRRAGDPEDPRLRSAFCRAFLRSGDGEAAARRAGVSRRTAATLARRLLSEEAIWQEIEELRGEERYADSGLYRPPPEPLCAALYHCCVQKIASQWLKAVFQDPAFFRATGLRVRPFVQLGHRLARRPGEMPHGTLLTHLYIDRRSFQALPKPADHRWFFVQRDPRDALLSWYHSARSSHVAVAPIPSLRARLLTMDFATGLGFLIERLMEWGYFESLAGWSEVPLGEGRFRYEDLARDERRFLHALFTSLSVPLPPAEIDALAARHSFERLSGGRAKGVEDTSSHYRIGKPGHWRQILPGDVLERLRLVTDGLAERLGYSD